MLRYDMERNEGKERYIYMKVTRSPSMRGQVRLGVFVTAIRTVCFEVCTFLTPRAKDKRIDSS